jgi:hypothetical protein
MLYQNSMKWLAYFTQDEIKEVAREYGFTKLVFCVKVV